MGAMSDLHATLIESREVADRIAAENALSKPATAGTLIERANEKALVDGWFREAAENGEIVEGVAPDYLAELLDVADLPFREKIERTGLAALRREQQADAIGVEIKRLQARKAAAENEAARIKRYAQLCLEIAGETKVAGTLCTVAIQQNPPSVRGELPTDTLVEMWADGSPFVKAIPTSYTLDKKALLERAKLGGTLPEGLTVERSVSLRIR